MCTERLQKDTKKAAIMRACFIFGGIGNWVGGGLRLKRIIHFMYILKFLTYLDMMAVQILNKQTNKNK